MRRTLTIAAIAVLVLAGVVRLVAAPSRTAGGIDDSLQTAISIQDLHAGYPAMDRLPVEAVPQP